MTTPIQEIRLLIERNKREVTNIRKDIISLTAKTNAIATQTDELQKIVDNEGAKQKK